MILWQLQLRRRCKPKRQSKLIQRQLTNIKNLIQNQDFGRRKIWSENINFESKIKISRFSRSLISNLMVSNWDSREIKENDFGILKIKFQAQTFKIAIEFQVSRCRFCIFPNFGLPISHFSGIQIVEKLKIQILAESVAAFSSNFDPNFSFFRVVVQHFPSHLAK